MKIIRFERAKEQVPSIIFKSSPRVCLLLKSSSQLEYKHHMCRTETKKLLIYKDANVNQLFRIFRARTLSN
ncbi:hypothetical protein J0S82_010890, partial [Galemys pyrenaicus]